ncbi:DUF742 domain-containing protein [Streptomyces liangshanensis]|uniref:DUF742 domain-containing protein n=1 Tax=Streptomyces liangshanensis TaxID=2717324 RepID=A0A6G9GZH4_9ACTN|nr:DUF742 domain-containing protein [Streptomyces liangshanensis]QIQ03620.1 DUF742 domain-containing protein [Streptomyces liangshanensis]
MRHWAEGFDDDDDDEQLVRPYTITSGRTAPERADLTLITLLTTVPDITPRGALAARRMQPEHRTILAMCREPKAVVEVAAELGLPVSLTKILIGDLVDSGQMWARAPRPFTRPGGLPDMTILEAVRDGLRQL